MNALHLSESSEHYTPQEIIELAREVLEGIDLDPFSCEFANSRVKAKKYFSKREDGLFYPWINSVSPSSVFLNPPSKLFVFNSKGKKVQKSGAKEAWIKLMREVKFNHVSHAIVVAYSLEQLQITQNCKFRSMLAFPLCVGAKRFDFVDCRNNPQNQGTHASAIIYVPNIKNNSRKFKELFTSIGEVLNIN